MRSIYRATRRPNVIRIAASIAAGTLDQQAALLAKQRGVTKEQFIKSEKARIDREVLEAAKRGKQLAAHPNHPRAFGRPS